MWLNKRRHFLCDLLQTCQWLTTKHFNTFQTVNDKLFLTVCTIAPPPQLTLFTWTFRYNEAGLEMVRLGLRTLTKIRKFQLFATFSLELKINCCQHISVKNESSNCFVDKPNPCLWWSFCIELGHIYTNILPGSIIIALGLVFRGPCYQALIYR